MRKRVLNPGPRRQVPKDTWLDPEQVAQVEVTSEDAAHPIEAALLPGRESGWRAAEPGEQTIRLIFDQPLRLRRIWLHFVELAAERTQEFVVRWSADEGRSFRDLVRQQYTFSPQGATSEVEDFQVDLSGVTAIQLTIVPDQGRGRAHASLAGWRLA
jgi:hypothetical protein